MNDCGFSQVAYRPEIIAEGKKRVASSLRFSFIFAIFLFGLFVIISFISEEVELIDALVIGGLIAFFIIIFGIFRSLDSKRSPWEGIVVDKKTKRKREKQNYEDDDSRYYDEYTTYFREDSGKKHTYVEKDRRDMYDYFVVGERVKFHPLFGTYEKYDKSNKNYMYCNICRAYNEISSDICQDCKKPLFK